ncbi:MAG TPA: hypothetical protein VKP60_06300, partial [Magnetospirillaceae bacterium]|nr:hypothetical protein [Magnetospirillaceae bacterium]
LVLALLAFARETPLGKRLHQLLVEGPAAAIGRLTFGHLLGVGILLTLAGIVIYLGGADGLRMVAAASPDLGIWFALFDVGTYVDALVFVAAVSAFARFASLRPLIAAYFGRYRGRQRRSRRRIKPASAADEEDGLVIAYAI